MRNKLCFIGAINRNGEIQGGETIKNQLLLDFLIKKKFDIDVFDTISWQKRIGVILVNILKCFVSKSHHTIIISTGSRGANYFLKLSNLLNFRKKKIYYFVIGGLLGQKIMNGTFKVRNFRNVSQFFVETNDLKEQLKNLGFQNVKVVPNFKTFNYTPEKKFYKEKKIIKMFFLSRILPEKGVELIFDSLKELNKTKTRFSVDFYGPIDKKYESSFRRKINENNYANYLGFIDLSKDDNYKKLSNYDIFIFPTFHIGEGFPGAIIDSYIAGVPVVTSDWKYNSELIDKDATGYLFQNKNIKSMKAILEDLFYNSKKLIEMRINCEKKAKIYHTDNVLSFLPKYLEKDNETF